MSELKMTDAVLISVRYLYGGEPSTLPTALLTDVTRAVARVYNLRDQSPTQEIGEKLAEQIGVDKFVKLEDAVYSKARSLWSRGFAKLQNKAIQLTAKGVEEAESKAQQRWLVDSGIYQRIEQDPYKAPKHKASRHFNALPSFQAPRVSGGEPPGHKAQRAFDGANPFRAQRGSGGEAPEHKAQANFDNGRPPTPAADSTAPRPAPPTAPKPEPPSPSSPGQGPRVRGHSV
jgi:hypothetical protein